MVNKLQIKAAVKQGRTILEDCFFTQPFRVANISEDRKDPALYLMVMSSSPGLLDQDEYAIEVDVQSGAELVLQSQAYQRIFKMKGSASINQQVSLAENATLYYVPHPVVPHKGSTLISQTSIYLRENAALMFADILTCGRKLSGESFEYSSFRNRVELFYRSKLIYKDNIVIEPKQANISAIGQLEGFSHQAGFLIADTSERLHMILEPLYDLLKSESLVSFGITRAHNNLIAGRILGNGGERLYQLLKRMEALVRLTKRKQSVPTAPEIIVETTLP